jgi:hypothetical protein
MSTQPNQADDDRLLRLFADTVEKNPNNRRAIRSDVLSAVRYDLPLLWTMTKDWHGNAMDVWISRGYDARSSQSEKAKNDAMPTPMTAGSLNAKHGIAARAHVARTLSKVHR